MSIATIASLSLGAFLDVSSTRSEGEALVYWVEGISIILAILIAVIVGSLDNWQKARQFGTLNQKKQHRLVKVSLDGGEQLIPISQVVVGDVVLLEPGDVIPCDGIFLSGHNVRCDESSGTGKPSEITMLSYEECIALRDKQLTELDPDGPCKVELLKRADCFIVSGSKILEGAGTYVVIAVGSKSLGLFIALPPFKLSDAPLTLARSRGSESTPLQLKLNDLADAIAQIGRVVGGLLFVALLIRYFFEPGTVNLQRYVDLSALSKC